MTEEEAKSRIKLLEEHIDTLKSRLSLPTSQDYDIKINELNSQVTNLQAQMVRLGNHADALEKKLRENNEEKSRLENERQRLLQENTQQRAEITQQRAEITQLRREVNNVIVSVPPSEQEKFIMQMAEFSAEQIELTKMQIASDLKNQILSNMEIMTADKRYEYFETCRSMFGNVVVINKIIPELKNYLRNSIKNDSKPNLQINIDNSQTNQNFDVKGEGAEIYPQVSKITHNWNK